MGKLLLCCMCLLALAALLYADLNANRCKELHKVATAILKHMNNTHPHSFHVPTDIKTECLGSALTCFRWQVPDLHAANGQKKAGFFKLVKKLKLSKPLEQKGCIPCSNYTTHRPKKFMKDMEMLLQQIITQKA